MEEIEDILEKLRGKIIRGEIIITSFTNGCKYVQDHSKKSVYKLEMYYKKNNNEDTYKGVDRKGGS